MAADIKITSADALLIIDVQNDFCPGGALAIEEGDRIIKPLNEWIRKFADVNGTIFASRDWHPREHISFIPQGGLWPPHCIQDTPGAQFHPSLDLPETTIVVTKGVRFDQDQNSAFDQTGLGHFMHRKGIQRLFLAGLALDVCVAATAMDASKIGFKIILISAATRPVNMADGHKALDRMRAAGMMIMDAGG